MTKPIIGITANVRPNPAHEDIKWSYAPSGFVEGVQKAGGLAILLPVSDPSE
ncbi:gamma-glutamyl-gamma-aminobutyrate hydrolase family protein, partial [Streptococcus thermophilus]|nr:gamma-glutamyl-gamma-aminobutyrate hydrolase family protein [Streptococcus thermophilus]